MKFSWAWLLCILLSLAGCGGGGGSTGPAPVVTITSQPVDQSVVDGDAAEFRVAATHASAYQWQVSTGAGWEDVSAATQTRLVIGSAVAVMNGYRYRVVVSGEEGHVVSSAATLRVTPASVAPAILVAPADQTVLEGDDAVFNVTATGTSPAYQWQASRDGLAWSDRAGAKAPQLRLEAIGLSEDGSHYRVRVSNAAGEEYSMPARLHVQALPVAPVITSHPANASVAVGWKATFGVVAAGTPVPDLQWQASIDGGGTWTDIASATSSAYTRRPRPWRTTASACAPLPATAKARWPATPQC
jgi:hypothetical protein